MIVPKFKSLLQRLPSASLTVLKNSCRTMSQDHLQRTSDNSRNEVVSLATVIGMRDESKTVKSLTLKVHEKQLTFKAGQWVDMVIPDVETVGGFSMCSSPYLLESEQTLELAVKYSQHPPAHWVHTQCKTGSSVHLQVSGDFIYDPQRDSNKDLLLVAGGVGINPLFSIINTVADLCGKGDNSVSSVKESRVTLLYTARSEDELIFKKQIQAVSSCLGNIRCQFFVTRSSGSGQSSDTRNGRIGMEDIAKCFDWLRKEQTVAYICGPSPMITDMEEMCAANGLHKSDIHFEKWW